MLNKIKEKMNNVKNKFKSMVEKIKGLFERLEDGGFAIRIGKKKIFSIRRDQAANIGWTLLCGFITYLYKVFMSKEAAICYGIFVIIVIINMCKAYHLKFRF